MRPALPRASLFASLPVPDPVAVAMAGRAVWGAMRTAARLGGWLLAGTAAAGVMWVIVAGPGFVSERSSTASARHPVRVAVR